MVRMLCYLDSLIFPKRSTDREDMAKKKEMDSGINVTVYFAGFNKFQGWEDINS